MSALASSLVSSASRPLRLRLRGDLVAREQRYQGRRSWVVKDPLSLKYYRFEEEEYALLTWLDGNESLQGLRDRFEREFAPQKISLQEIHQFVGAMHRASLVISDAANCFQHNPSYILCTWRMGKRSKVFKVGFNFRH